MLKNGPVAPSANSQESEGSGIAAESCPAPKSWPLLSRYMARSTMTGTPLVDVTTADTSASSRPEPSPLT